MSALARCIASRLYRVEAVIGYRLVQVQPPRQKFGRSIKVMPQIFNLENTDRYRAAEQ